MRSSAVKLSNAPRAPWSVNRSLTDAAQRTISSGWPARWRRSGCSASVSRVGWAPAGSSSAIGRPILLAKRRAPSTGARGGRWKVTIFAGRERVGGKSASEVSRMRRCSVRLRSWRKSSANAGAAQSDPTPSITRTHSLSRKVETSASVGEEAAGTLSSLHRWVHIEWQRESASAAAPGPQAMYATPSLYTRRTAWWRTSAVARAVLPAPCRPTRSTSLRRRSECSARYMSTVRPTKSSGGNGSSERPSRAKGAGGGARHSRDGDLSGWSGQIEESCGESAGRSTKPVSASRFASCALSRGHARTHSRAIAKASATVFPTPSAMYRPRVKEAAATSRSCSGEAITWRMPHSTNLCAATAE
mmetsp:Transcript_28151/g.68326  ORF Transcript_28151/g.68326 Transcript_28151/m.68326 type:complete len:360 (-) Transcript_28151:421-1500(-)